MSVISLSSLSNWRLIVQEERRVRFTEGNVNSQESKYRPIDPIFTLAESSIILAGVSSDTALQHWYLGARISQYNYISPSNKRRFISGVQTSEQKKIRLNQLTLLNFEDYKIYPYVLAAEFPYWLEHIYYEAWEFTGVYNSINDVLLNLQSQLNEIKVELEKISN